MGKNQQMIKLTKVGQFYPSLLTIISAICKGFILEFKLQWGQSVSLVEHETQASEKMLTVVAAALTVAWY